MSTTYTREAALAQFKGFNILDSARVGRDFVVVFEDAHKDVQVKVVELSNEANIVPVSAKHAAKLAKKIVKFLTKDNCEDFDALAVEATKMRIAKKRYSLVKKGQMFPVTYKGMPGHVLFFDEGKNFVLSPTGVRVAKVSVMEATLMLKDSLTDEEVLLGV